MKKTFFLLILILLQPVNAVIISEVLYDPASSENNGEAIMLYNPSNYAIDLSGFAIATKASQKDAVLPQNTSIQARGYLLITDPGFSLDKDDSSWPDPDYEETLNLANQNGGVALMNGSEIIDAVGWGSASSIGEGLYEGTPAFPASEGQSLKRINNQDTNDNSVDFEVGIPFQTSTSTVEDNPSSPSEAIIELEINITINQTPDILIKISRDDNASKSGVQINPEIGTKTYFEVIVEVNHSGQLFQDEKIVIDSEEFILKNISHENNKTIYKANVSMNYYDKARDYAMTAEISTAEQTYKEVAVFEYTSLIAIETDAKVSFRAHKGGTDEKKIIVRNLGNEDLKLKIKSTELLKNEKRIPRENLKVSADNFVTHKILSNEEYLEQILPRGKDSELELTLKISAPEEADTGNYKGQIIIKGEKA